MEGFVDERIINKNFKVTELSIITGILSSNLLAVGRNLLFLNFRILSQVCVIRHCPCGCYFTLYTFSTNLECWKCPVLFTNSSWLNKQLFLKSNDFWRYERYAWNQRYAKWKYFTIFLRLVHVFQKCTFISFTLLYSLRLRKQKWGFHCTFFDGLFFSTSSS